MSDTTARFEQVVLVHLDAAYNLARWLTRNETDAQDIVQDACVRALRSFDQFHGGDARAWLLTIVRNLSYTFLTARKAVVNYDDDVHEPVADNLDPQLILERSTDSERVRHAIEQLPTELRTVIVLRELEELSYKEIAGVTGMPIGTVMSRLSRGRERLAKLLTEPMEVEKAI